MRRARQTELTPHERDELARMLNTLVRVKEAIRSFDDGEVNLRDAVAQIVATLSAVRVA